MGTTSAKFFQVGNLSFDTGRTYHSDAHSRSQIIILENAPTSLKTCRNYSLTILSKHDLIEKFRNVGCDSVARDDDPETEICDKLVEMIPEWSDICFDRHALINIQSHLTQNVHACFQNENELFLISDFLCGGDLRYNLSEREFDLEETIFYAAQILLIIELAHSHHILLRDLHPEILALDSSGYLRLTSFASARRISQSGDKINEPMHLSAKLEYTAPEIWKGEFYGEAADVWTFGTLLFEMSFGKRFSGNSSADLMYFYHKRHEIFSILPANVASILTLALDIDAKKRPSLEQLRGHALFEELDWDHLVNRRIDPPFIPLEQANFSGAFDLFMEYEEVAEHKRELSVEEQAKFEDWDYISSGSALFSETSFSAAAPAQTDASQTEMEELEAGLRRPWRRNRVGFFETSADQTSEGAGVLGSLFRNFFCH
eukprot:TRINITY_DN4597_c0_g1_i1.p1 TRINITY_DN4597_c0_g1~~TRINITY_DN4597_c0_g1_i1.p1  ORF type:complete len:431 (+),score=96.05 TRINITY_DN4597_c0_g1_i1:55-1347(+)